MRSSDYLFRLIKALSKGDRRNFKLFAQLQDGDKQYIKLFDAIDKQLDYDEDRLLKQFEGEKFTNQFSVAKNYLYNYILKTLHIFRKDAKTELNALLHQVQILMSKNLFEQAQKLLRKAKHLADRQERFPELMFILETQRNLLLKREQAKEFQAFIEQIQQDERDAGAKIINLMEYGHIYDDVYHNLKRSISARDTEIKVRIEEILNLPLVADASKPLSVRARLRRYNILVDCYRLLNDLPKQLETLQLLVATYDANEEMQIEKGLSYINAISNLGVAQYKLGNINESFAALNKLRSISVDTEEAEIHVFEKYFQFKVGLCIETGNVEEGRAVIAEFERDYPQREGTIMKAVELSIFYNITYFYIYIGEPGKALEWVNRILNEPRTELRTDLQSVARIMNLIIHFELGNWELLEYGLKSATRFLANRDRLFMFEKTILKYIRQLSSMDPRMKSSDLLLEFRAEIKTVIEDKFEKQAMSLFNIISWIDGRLESATMRQIEFGGAQEVKQVK
jgi:hypothetical protein